MTWPIQQPMDDAEPLEGDHLYTVALSIPQLGGSSPQDVGETFVRVLRDWFEGAVDTLALDVTDEHTNGYHIVDVRAKDVV